MWCLSVVAEVKVCNKDIQCGVEKNDKTWDLGKCSHGAVHGYITLAVKTGDTDEYVCDEIWMQLGDVLTR